MASPSMVVDNTAFGDDTTTSSIATPLQYLSKDGTVIVTQRTTAVVSPGGHGTATCTNMTFEYDDDEAVLHWPRFSCPTTIPVFIQSPFGFNLLLPSGLTFPQNAMVKGAILVCNGYRPNKGQVVMVSLSMPDMVRVEFWPQEGQAWEAHTNATVLSGSLYWKRK